MVELTGNCEPAINLASCLPALIVAGAYCLWTYRLRGVAPFLIQQVVPPPQAPPTGLKTYPVHKGVFSQRDLQAAIVSFFPFTPGQPVPVKTRDISEQINQALECLCIHHNVPGIREHGGRSGASMSVSW